MSVLRAIPGLLVLFSSDQLSIKTKGFGTTALLFMLTVEMSSFKKYPITILWANTVPVVSKLLELSLKSPSK
jgi:hypothetical protein